MNEEELKARGFDIGKHLADGSATERFLPLIPKPTGNPEVDEKQDEKAFQADVVRFAQRAGWLVYHTYDSRKSQPGFPDLTMVRKGWLIIAELKVGKNTLEPAQKDWADALHTVEMGNESVFYFVWYPKDWPQIIEVLT